MEPMTSPGDQAASLTLEQQVSLLSGRNFWQTRDLPDAGITSVTTADGPHGLRVQARQSDHLGIGASLPSTCFPPAVTLGATWDPDLAAEVGRAIADEARDLGVGIVLGPGVNLKRHPLGGRNFEYFSEDPLLTGRLATAWVRGLQERKVGASLKHFAANNQEDHRFVSSSVVDERTLRELYLRAFEHVVRDAQPWTVMSSYNLLNGVPVSSHRWLLTDVLRDEWGFEGLVVSDWGAMGDRAAGVAAGLDLEMPGGHRLNDRSLVRAVESGRLAADAVRTSAARVIALAARVGRRRGSGEVRDVDAHDALARRVAAAGTVLLTNDGVLPLPPSASVALCGSFATTPRYQGAGSSRVRPTRTTSLIQALQARGVSATWSATAEQAVAAARDADVAVVMVGLPPAYESEGFDRDHLRLPPEHDALVEAVCAANPRTVVVLSNGAPVLMPWRDRPAAIVEAYLGGQASGAALADVLFGDAEPGGRLAESFPAAQGDVASDAHFPGRPRQVEYREGLAVGYRHHTTHGVAPAFAFGHGLSYADFTWSDAALSSESVAVTGDGEVEPLSVSLTVTNTSARGGSEVVQVYRHDRTSVVARPRRELFGFAKVDLAAGESARIKVAIDPRGFAFWDVASRAWQVPSGDYSLEVGRSSEAIEATLPLVVTGGVKASADTGPLVASSGAAFSERLGGPVPEPVPTRPFSRDSTLGELRTTPGGALVARIITRTATKRTAGDAAEGEGTEMVVRSLEQLPLRAFAAFGGGKLSWKTVDLLVAFAEGPRALLALAARRRRGPM
jgi:beta-glucosidase